MNLKVLKWLLAHRDVLIKVMDAAKHFNKDGLYIDQWDVVDNIARIVIPVFEKEGTDVNSLTVYEFEDETVGAFAMGAEVQAMGIDWQQLVNVILPILIAILKAFTDE